MGRDRTEDEWTFFRHNRSPWSYKTLGGHPCPRSPLSSQAPVRTPETSPLSSSPTVSP